MSFGRSALPASFSKRGTAARRSSGSIFVFRQLPLLPIRPSFEIALLVTLILLGIVVSPAHATDLPRAVKTITVSPPYIGLERTFFGRVAAKHSVDLAFQVDGKIVELNAEEGAELPAGAVIGRLDSEPFENSLRRAEVGLEEATRTVRRYEQLNQRTVSEVSLQDARSQQDLADVAFDEAAYALDRSVLYAPFDAVVAVRHVEAYSTISAGTPIVTLLDLSELRIDIRVPEVLFQQLGNDPNLRLEAKFPGSAERFPVGFREVNAIASDI